jgi:hypothetical protein
VHAQAVFADAGVVAQAGGAGITGAGGDLCKSVAHGNVCLTGVIESVKGEKGRKTGT